MNIHYFSIAPRRLASLATPFVSTAVLWASVALAQPAPTPPVAPRMTEAAPAGFKSVLDGYKPYTEEKTVNWKAANDTTAQIGGWRAYAKEAAQTSPAQNPAPTDPANPAKP